MAGMFSAPNLEDVYNQIDTEYLNNAVGGRNSTAAGIGNLFNKGLQNISAMTGGGDTRIIKAKQKQEAIDEVRQQGLTPADDPEKFYAALTKAFSNRGLMDEAVATAEVARKMSREAKQDARADRQVGLEERRTAVVEAGDRRMQDLHQFETQLKSMSIQEKQLAIQNLTLAQKEMQAKKDAIDRNPNYYDKKIKLELEEQEAKIKAHLDSAKASLISANASASRAALDKRKWEEGEKAYTEAQAKKLKEEVDRAQNEQWDTIVKFNPTDNSAIIIKTEKRPKAGFKPAVEYEKITPEGFRVKITEQDASSAAQAGSGLPKLFQDRQRELGLTQ